MKKLLIIYHFLLLLLTILILLMEFVIPHGGEVIEEVDITNQYIDEDLNLEDLEEVNNEYDLPNILKYAEILGTYQNDETSITIYSFRMYGSDVYVADVYTTDATNIMSGLAYDTFGGKNVTETVSEMAEDNNAIFAINADYASHYDEGIVIKNGQILRSSISDREAVALYYDGTVDTFSESNTSASELLNAGAWQVWSFGPILLEDSIIVSSTNDGVSRNEVDNPRSAFGIVSENHYMFVTIDGRSNDSDGVDIEELADIMLEIGCTEAYNFDGGGSATMWFDGEVINNPSSGDEREVGDCVYIVE